jgi:hypothetical protein
MPHTRAKKGIRRRRRRSIKKLQTRRGLKRKKNSKQKKTQKRIKLVKPKKGRCPTGYTPYISQPGSKMKKRCIKK